MSGVRGGGGGGGVAGAGWGGAGGGGGVEWVMSETYLLRYCR